MRKFDDSIPIKLLKAREAAMSFFRPILQEAGITEQQWRVIRALNEYDELESKKLAELCCLLSPSLTGIVNRLEQMELIQRRRSSEDQRRVLISLSPKARELFQQLSPRLESRYRQMTEQLADGEIDQLMQLLDKLLRLKP